MAATVVTEDIEFRAVSLNDFEKRLDANDAGTFEGYACRFGIVDSYGTTFVERCWTSGGLDDGTYALLSMHDERHVVGAFTAEETEEGLYIRGRYDDTPEGQAARARAKSGSAGELSVGFLRTGVDPADETRITGARLYEVSQITARMASQPMAALSMVRSAVDKKVEENEALKEHDELKPEEIVDAPTGEVNTETESEAPAEENSDLEEERAAKPTCRACGKGVRKFICSTCLNNGVKGKTAGEARMDIPEEVRAMSHVAGSYEERMMLLRNMLTAWMTRKYNVDANDSYVSLEATFDDSVVFSVGSWADEAPEELVMGQTWRVAYVVNEGGQITLGEPTFAELVTVVRDAKPALEIRSETPEVPNGENPEGDNQETPEESVASEEPQEQEKTPESTPEEPKSEGNSELDADEQRQRAQLRIRLLSLV
jgi:HK97 family phage prohead protease